METCWNANSVTANNNIRNKKQITRVSIVKSVRCAVVIRWFQLFGGNRRKSHRLSCLKIYTDTDLTLFPPIAFTLDRFNSMFMPVCLLLSLSLPLLLWLCPYSELLNPLHCCYYWRFCCYSNSFINRLNNTVFMFYAKCLYLIVRIEDTQKSLSSSRVAFSLSP